MAERVESGARQNVGDLAAQQRDVLGGRGERLRREQANDAQFAGDRAVVEALDADIIHVVAAVDARGDVGLGDDQRIGRGQEGAQLRRGGHQVAAAPQHLDVGVAQQTEPFGPGAARLLHVGVRIAVGAGAEEDEIVVGQPLQEGQRLLPLGRRQIGRLGAQGDDRLLELRLHGREIVGRLPHLLDQRRQPPDERLARRGVGDGRHVDVDEAFALGIVGRPGARPSGRGGEGFDPAVAAPGDVEDGVQDQPHRMAGRMQFRQHGIEDERPVSRRDLDDGVRAPLQVLARKIVDANRGRLLARGEEGEGVAGDLGQRLGGVFDQVLAGGVREQQVREARRPVVALGKSLAGGGDKFARLGREAVWHGGSSRSSGARPRAPVHGSIGQTRDMPKTTISRICRATL